MGFSLFSMWSQMGIVAKLVVLFILGSLIYALIATIQLAKRGRSLKGQTEKETGPLLAQLKAGKWESILYLEQVSAKVSDGVWRLTRNSQFFGVAAMLAGLFGTLMGILNALRYLAIKPELSRAHLSAGLAEALLTTIIGLLVGFWFLLLTYFGYRRLFKNRQQLTENIVAAIPKT